jgi:undecaprenyl phosphate-alpha-L-ara4FN deformylase
MPTTLPTLDELIGRPDLGNVDPIDHLIALTDGQPDRDHVYTLHAELEGNTYLDAFERLIRGWRDRGAQLTDLATFAGSLDLARLPRCEMVDGTVAGRSGLLAYQGPPAR